MVVVIAGCGPSDREQDCAKVREILVPPQRTDVPRRYWSYDKPGAQVVDMSPYDKLKQTTWRTGEVRDAVRGFIDESGWISYTPYYDASKAASATETLFRMCKVPGTIGVTR
jgi:hypothetical protein